MCCPTTSADMQASTLIASANRPSTHFEGSRGGLPIIIVTTWREGGGRRRAGVRAQAGVRALEQGNGLLQLPAGARISAALGFPSTF